VHILCGSSRLLLNEPKQLKVYCFQPIITDSFYYFCYLNAVEITGHARCLLFFWAELNPRSAILVSRNHRAKNRRSCSQLCANTQGLNVFDLIALHGSLPRLGQDRLLRSKVNEKRQGRPLPPPPPITMVSALFQQILCSVVVLCKKALCKSMHLRGDLI